MIAMRLLDCLEKVRTIDDCRWAACCPAHDDRMPSLSIRETPDRVLINCFAGCAAADVLAAVGLTFSDLYPDDPWKASREAAYAHPIPTPAIDPLDHERMILMLARAQLQHGEPLKLEDEARMHLALARLRAQRAAA